MERDDLASLAGFLSDTEPLVRGGVAQVGEDGAHHMRVRRLNVGDRIYLADGKGTQAVGSITRLGKKNADVTIDDVLYSDRAPAVDVIVPVADRDRMLWCAEKCAELGATSWRPVMYHRSRSVSPRGKGESFAQRVRGRMASAIIQSHAPWLPDVLPDASLEKAIAATASDGSRLVLDARGTPITNERFVAPVTIAVGPEGGFDDAELDQLRAASFHPVSLGANVLRFETAVVGALAIVRAALSVSQESVRG